MKSVLCMNQNNLFRNNRECGCNENSRNRYSQKNNCDNNLCCLNCPPGEPGPAEGVAGYADFYALMPPDNAASVAPGIDVSFPQDGPTSGVDIVRTGPDPLI